MEDEVVLMFANGPEIRAFVQDKNEEFDVITSEKRIEAIDYDPKQEMVFWADSYDKTIKRSYMINALNGQVKSGFAQDLNMKGSSKPTALAVDYIGENLYWTETDRTGAKPRGRVMVARTDGRYRRALVSAGIESPTSLALAPQLGKMYWTDAGSAPKIEIAWMDGSQRRPIITENIRHPTGLAIDQAMDHAIYWADAKLNTIEMMKHDGTNRRVILKGDFLKHPLSLDVFESSLYWVTRDTGELVRQDKFGRGVPLVISKDLVNPSAVKGELTVLITMILCRVRGAGVTAAVLFCNVTRVCVQCITPAATTPRVPVLAPRARISVWASPAVGAAPVPTHSRRPNEPPWNSSVTPVRISSFNNLSNKMTVAFLRSMCML